MGNLSYDMLFCLLILYAFVSWAVEVVFFALWDRRFVNRGFLNLPLNLHCGLAAAILAAALPTLERNLLMQYLLTLVVFGIVHRFADQYVQNRQLVSRQPGTKYRSEVLRVAVTALIAGAYLIVYLVVHPMIVGALMLAPDWSIRLFDIVMAILIVMDFLCVRFTLHTSGAAKRLRSTQRLAQWMSDAVWKRLKKAYPAAPDGDPNQHVQPVFARGLCTDKLIWVFLISSFLGAMIEMVYCRLTGGTWMNRSSVLYGAFSFVWGLGAVVLTVVLQRLADKNDRWVFLAGFVVGGAYEYLCSVFTEVVFGTVFWDYSHMPMNIGGRTNVIYCIFWGLLAVLWVKVLYPPMSRLIEKLPPLTGKFCTWVIVVLMACNGMLTAGAMIRYSERQAGIKRTNSAAAFFDARYDDAWMEARWPNMLVLQPTEAEVEPPAGETMPAEEGAGA